MVEPWLAGLWTAFGKSYGATGGDDDATATSSGSDGGPESEAKPVDAVESKHGDIAVQDGATLQKYLPANLITYEKMFGPRSGPTQTPDDVPRLQVSMFQTHYHDEQMTLDLSQHADADSQEWSISNPFLGSVVAAKYLTSNESERKVLALEVDLGESAIQFKPGDSIGVKCPNPVNEVDALLSRLGLDGSKWVTIEPTAPSGRLSKKAATSSSRFPTSTTVRDLFLHHADIRSSPKKAVVRALAMYCSDDEEQAQMLMLSSKQGAGKYKVQLKSAHWWRFSHILTSNMRLFATTGAYRGAAGHFTGTFAALLVMPPAARSCSQPSPSVDAALLLHRIVTPRRP